MSKHSWIGLVAALALGSAACPGGGGAWELDGAFGEAGRVTTALGGADDEARALTVLADGRAVLVGEARADAASLRSFATVRYLPDGRLDPRFGQGGEVFTAFDDSFPSGALAVAEQPDGKLVVAGYARHPQRAHDGFAVVRYLPDGALDEGFAAGGGVLTAIDPESGAGRNDVARAVAVDEKGRIVVAGETGGAFKDIALLRYLPDGRLDEGFGAGGGVITDVGGNDAAYSVALQPDGKILVGGSGWRPGGHEDFVLVRYLADGRLDPSFGQGGVVTTDFRGGSDRGQSLVLRPDGKIVLGGVLQLSGGCSPMACERYGLAVAQYSAAGQLDAGFGEGGKVQLELLSSSGGYGLARLRDGHLALAGHIGNEDFVVALLREDGAPEPAFGDGGVQRTSFGPGTDRAVAAGALPDGNLVVGGRATIDTGAAFALARYRLR